MRVVVLLFAEINDYKGAGGGHTGDVGHYTARGCAH